MAGDPVDLLDQKGHAVARGLVNFDATELPGLLGRSTRDLARELGPAYGREVVHRDDLVLLRAGDTGRRAVDGWRTVAEDGSPGRAGAAPRPGRCGTSRSRSSATRSTAAEVRAALERLTHEQPFLLSARYAADRAELRYWEEARDLEDAAALALRLWGEHRRHRRAARRGGSPASRWSTGPPSSAARMDSPAPALVPAGGVRPF